MEMYIPNFKASGYITTRGNDNIEGVKELTKEKLIDVIGIRKKGTRGCLSIIFLSPWAALQWERHNNGNYSCHRTEVQFFII